MNQSVTEEFLSQSIFWMEKNTPRIKKCLEMLTEEEVWQKPNGSSNSIGNLVLHLCGNITQYIISSLGGVEDKRKRDEEFSATGGFNKKELMDKLTATVDEAMNVIRDLDRNDLLTKRAIQSFEYSAIAILIHVAEHYSYHTGQIAFYTKMLKDKDLSYYRGVDLNKKNLIE